jgi:hypothetical protein
MSIATLKRKSQRFVYPISHNQSSNGFALNGTLRNSGWIGQTSLDRIGSGRGNSCSVPQTSIVKKSTMNTLGYLSSRVRYPVSAGCSSGICDPLNTFLNNNKKVGSNNDHTASGHIANLVNNTICTNGEGVINDPTEFKSQVACSFKGCSANSYYIGGRLVANKPFNKDVSSFVAMSAGDYIQRRKKPSS